MEGGSLELAIIKDKKISVFKSLPLGTSLITQNCLNDINLISQIIKQEFETLYFPNLYLIGGALRLIGRSYMKFIRYPLKNLHNLEIDYEEFKLYLDKLSANSSKAKTHYEPKIDLNAIIVAKAMLNIFASKKVIISNYGLKEGVRFYHLPAQEQQKNIIYERIKTLVNFDENNCKIQDYIEIIKPILMKPDLITIGSITLVIMLARHNKNIDKTLRSNFIVEFILASDIPFSHRQRLMLSIALTLTYTSKNNTYINKLAKRMICKYDYCNSYIIGNFVRIAREVDGPEFSSPSFFLKLQTNKYIEISTVEILPRSVFAKVCGHLKNIGLLRKNIY